MILDHQSQWTVGGKKWALFLKQHNPSVGTNTTTRVCPKKFVDPREFRSPRG